MEGGSRKRKHSYVEEIAALYSVFVCGPFCILTRLPKMWKPEKEELNVEGGSRREEHSKVEEDVALSFL